MLLARLGVSERSLYEPVFATVARPRLVLAVEALPRSDRLFDLCAYLASPRVSL